MPIAYPDILKAENKGQQFSWTQKDVMLYALGIGMGADPMDRKELQFVYERDLNPHSPSKSLILLSGSQYFRYKSWC